MGRWGLNNEGCLCDAGILLERVARSRQQPTGQEATHGPEDPWYRERGQAWGLGKPGP